MKRIGSWILLATFVGATAMAPENAVAQVEPPARVETKKPDGFSGRTREGKARLLKEFGGSEEGEEAVMLGLAWLTQQQKPEGYWEYDDGHYTSARAAATGMAVLAFLGAGQSHKDGRFKQTVQAGLDWIVKNVHMEQGPNHGKIDTIKYMYCQGIATLALCEAYGMTGDPALKKPAQAAIDYIQRAQGTNGSWGYYAGQESDTSIVGWQIQALHAAMLTQDLVVDRKVIERALEFLDSVSSDRYKSTYGYRWPPGEHATSCTAIGLLCRYYVDGWRREHRGFAEGSQGLMKRAPTPADRNNIDLYYLYYATQVVRFYGGEEWKIWNEGPLGPDGKRRGGLPELLLSVQDRTPTHRGSWPAKIDWKNGQGFGRNCGRLGTTCMCLLTLEVYYRYLPEESTADPRKPEKPEKP